MSEETPPTPHSLNPMTTLTHVQEDNAFEALTDEELESVDGGFAPIFLLYTIMEVYSIVNH